MNQYVIHITFEDAFTIAFGPYRSPDKASRVFNALADSDDPALVEAMISYQKLRNVEPEDAIAAALEGT